MQDHKGNIVIVEDDAGLNRAVVRLLQTAGFHSFAFDTAESLLASNVAALADCFVLDIHLPGISGIELHARLGDAGLSRPVIFITAHDDADTRESVSVCGAAACLMKPFTGRMLIQAITVALSTAEPRDA